MLEKEFDFYQKNQKELSQKYPGRFIVIKNDAVIGDYATEQESYESTIKEHELGTFLIQQCLPGEETNTQTFYSRVIF